MSIEPLVRRTIFLGFRASAEQLWGAGAIDQIGRALPSEVQKDTTGPLIVREWLPESHVLAWYDAAFEAHCAGQRALFLKFIDRMVDHSFGRVRRLLLGMASPPMLAEKATELWRHDHTTGELSTTVEGPNTITIKLANHPYTSTARSREASCEVYRHIASLSRARGVSGKHALTEEGHLLCTYTWR